MILIILKVIWLLVWLSVFGYAVYVVIQRQFLRGAWLFVSALFGFLSLFVGFFGGRDLAGVFFSGIALCVIALGENSLGNLYYAITAPTYSLRMYAREDTFAFSLLLTLLGGLFMGLFASLTFSQLEGAFSTFANNFVGDALAGYPNPIYKADILSNGVGRMEAAFDVYYGSSFVWFPVLWLFLWLISGFLYWFLGRLFGSPAIYKEVLSGLAYWFGTNGIVMGFFYFYLSRSSLLAEPGSVSVSFLDVVGVLVSLLFLVYFIICISQSADIGAVQAVILFILINAVIGGIITAIMVYQTFPALEAFKSELMSADPSKI